MANPAHMLSENAATFPPEPPTPPAWASAAAATSSAKNSVRVYGMTKSIEPRPLSSEERALVEFLLSAEFPGRDELNSQLGVAEVVGICECGCGTVTLAVRGPAARA